MDVKEDYLNLILVFIFSLFGGIVRLINSKERKRSFAFWIGSVITSVFVGFVVYNFIAEMAFSINYKIAIVSVASCNSSMLLEILQKRVTKCAEKISPESLN